MIRTSVISSPISSLLGSQKLRHRNLMIMAKYQEKARLEHASPGNSKFQIYAIGNLSQSVISNDTIKDINLSDEAVLLCESDMQNGIFEDDCFNKDLYFKALLTVQFGRCLLWSPCLPSTQTILSKHFRSFPLGTVCVADSQLQGKGRIGNIWESPKGCLMFSFTLEMDNGRLLPFLQYVVSLALVEAIESVCLQKELPVLPIKIKWPNDIYANGMKIGGVLCTSTYSEKKFHVVIGIGLNVGNHKPTICLDGLLQDHNANSPPMSREELLAVFFKKFEDLFTLFLHEGFYPLECNYYKNWLHSGQSVVLEEKQDSITKQVPLVIQGLSPSGFLLALDDQLEKYELHPDGNSFDFFRGLLRRKLDS